MGRKKKKTAYSGYQLGFDPEKVPIRDGVAQVRIRYTHYLRGGDIARGKDALRARGARAAIVQTGPVENDDLAHVLHQLEQRGRPFHGGRVRFVGEIGGFPHFEIRFDSLD